MEKITYKCPRCGSSDISQVLRNATVRCDVNVTKDGGIEYSQPPVITTSYEDDTNYQCGNCGNHIVTGSEEDLLEAIGAKKYLHDGDIVRVDGAKLRWDINNEMFVYGGLASEARVYLDDKEIVLRARGEYEFVK